MMLETLTFLALQLLSSLVCSREQPALYVLADQSNVSESEAESALFSASDSVSSELTAYDDKDEDDVISLAPGTTLHCLIGVIV